MKKTFLILFSIFSVNLVVFSQGTIGSLDCFAAINNGTLTAGTLASGVSSIIPYTGGNGGSHNGQVVNSTGVTGLAANLYPGIFAVGPGTLIYNISGTPAGSGTASFALSVGGQACILNLNVLSPQGVISTLSCGTASNNGILIAGTASSGVSSSVPYTGGNGGAHNGQVVASTGVTGLTATLPAGTFTSGSGSLIYNITGTPQASGTANFALNIGGQTCNLSRTAYQPGSITSLSCGSATNTGTLTVGTAASGVTSRIPYNGGNGGGYAGQSVNSTGVTGLTATLPAGVFFNGSGSVLYTITGTPATSGTASFALNIGGKTCTLNRTVNLPAGTITGLNCSSATNSGTLTAGTAASGVSSSVPYTGGNGGTHSGQVVASTGVTGLTATLAAGTFASGSGSLIYNITGTPATSGTASFALNIGGKTCTLTRNVNLSAGTITALNCSSATNNGTLTSGSAASGVSSSVPYTGGNGGTHNGQTVASTGVTGLTATLAAGTFASGSGSLIYNITGTPATSGTASFALNIGGKTCTLTRTVNLLGTITALNCSSATNAGTLTAGTAAIGVSSSLPYTGGNGGTHNGQTVTSTGVTGLTATLAAGTFASGSGSLIYNITGTPAASGTASFALNIGGKTCTLNRNVNVCVPNSVYNQILTYGSVTDQQGNIYKTVVVGTQEWMAENLKTSVYANGNSIPNVTGNSQWSNLTTGAWCLYGNNSQRECPYGKLYNWYAVSDSRGLCPAGWHVPTTNDWTILNNYLGGQNIAGGKMKSTGTQYWLSPNTGATNESGFSGLPSGSRSSTGTSFIDLGSKSFWWSSSSISTNAADRLRLDYAMTNAALVSENKKSGFSVRCIKDQPSGSRSSNENGSDDFIPYTEIPTRSISLYPNPASNAVNVIINANAESQATVRIADMLGKVLMLKTESLVEGANLITYNLDQIPVGFYLVHIIKGEEESVIKLIRE